MPHKRRTIIRSFVHHPAFDRLHRDLHRAGVVGTWLTSDTIESLSGDRGAYLLAIQMDNRLALDLPHLGAPVLSPGPYVYAGSARGPGGLRGRIGRHFRRDKTRRWHVDHLTSACANIAALMVIDGDECSLVASLLATGRFAPAAPGFGSSDCRICPAHLLRPIRKNEQ